MVIENLQAGYQEHARLITDIIHETGERRPEEKKYVRNIVNIVGVENIGKSQLLQDIDAREYASPEHSPTIIQASKYIKEDIFYTIEFVKDILRHYVRAIPAEKIQNDPDLQRAIKTLENGNIENIMVVAMTIIEANEKPPVLIIDEWKDLAIYQDAESRVLESVLHEIMTSNNKPIVVIASEQRIHPLNQPSITNHIQPFPLTGISMYDLYETLPEELRSISTYIWTYSRGIPGVVNYILAEIEKNPDVNWSDEAELDKLLNSQSQYVEAVKNVMNSPLLLSLSSMNRFSLQDLTAMLPLLDPENFSAERVTDSIARDVLRSFGDHIVWNTEAPAGYQIHPTFKTLARDIERKFEKEKALELHQSMIERRKRQLSQKFHVTHLVDLLYHELSKASIEEKPEEEIWSTLLEIAVEKMNTVDDDLRAETIVQLATILRAHSDLSKYNIFEEMR